MATGDTDDVAYLRTALAPLVEPLYASLDRAVDLASAHFADYEMASSEYQPCEAHLARAHARRLLKAKQVTGELEPWVVAAPQPNVQICLAHEMLRLRLLRPDRLQVPKAGSNRARIAYYSNHHAQLFGVSSSLLIGLWAVDEEDQVRIQVVRTIGTERYDSRVPVDIDFWLPRAAEDIATLEFRPVDTDIEVELPFEEPGAGEEPSAK